MIDAHLEILTNDFHESATQHIFKNIMYSKYTTIKEYNLNFIKYFVSIPFGSAYLYDVFIRI